MMPSTSDPGRLDPARSDFEAFARLMNCRSTCRSYRKRAADRELIGSTVRMASRREPWCNMQSWRLVVTETAHCTESFGQALTAWGVEHPDADSDLPFPPDYDGVYAQSRRGAGMALYGAPGIVRENTALRNAQSFENVRLFDAPQMAIVTVSDKLGPYAAVDAGGLVASFLLSAHAHGVATIPQAALARYARSRYFDISTDQRMVCGISFGYAAGHHLASHFRTSRPPLDELLRFA